MLKVRELQAAYGDSKILFDINFELAEGEAVGVLGRNGMGKTTTFCALMGMLPPLSGTIVFRGREIRHLPSHQIARLGMAVAPEGRRIFPNLTVRENLVATAKRDDAGGCHWTLTRVMKLFPRLKQRQSNLGWQLSGGEQQMLAIGRALMTNPKLLLLDEATEGLAPQMRGEIWNCIRQLRQDGLSILIVDKDVTMLSEVCDRHIVLEKGRIAWTGSARAMKSSQDLRSKYLSV
jgi:branched-chain amino acid transport system ATP-binding protein